MWNTRQKFPSCLFGIKWFWIHLSEHHRACYSHYRHQISHKILPNEIVASTISKRMEVVLLFDIVLAHLGGEMKMAADFKIHLEVIKKKFSKFRDDVPTQANWVNIESKGICHPEQVFNNFDDQEIGLSDRRFGNVKPKFTMPHQINLQSSQSLPIFTLILLKSRPLKI